MANDMQVSRRRLIWITGSTALATGLAGCTGSEATETTADDSENSSSADGPVDRTGADTVTVDVGAGEGGLAFAPAEIRISTGTTVVWEWTGVGGGHNVVAEEGAFVSHQNRDTTDEEGYTFEHTFSETGSYDYVCQPHSKVGMVGSVDVVA